MRRHVGCGITWICLLVAVASEAVAAPDHLPRATHRYAITVIHDAGSTISTAPYLRRLSAMALQKDGALTDAQQRFRSLQPALVAPLDEAAFFPLHTDRLQPSDPIRRAVPGLLQPLFVIGLEPGSMQWLARFAEDLRAMGARGVVVQAPTYAAFDAVRRWGRERGLSIEAAAGAPLSDVYGLQTYPVLLDRGEGVH